MASMDERVLALGLDLKKFPLDHVGFRVATTEDYNIYLEFWKTQSVIISTKKFHDRNFNSFLLKEPLTYLDTAVYAVEFTEPGGSDAYETGFQHVEILTPLSFADLFPNQELIAPYYFAGKYDDETYLKWPDKMVLKLRNRPLSYMSTAEDNPTIEILPQQPAS